MRRCTLSIFLFLIIHSTFGQIGYEKGYFIDNEDNKTDCFIYNKDWRNNPSIIKFKIEEEGAVATKDMDSVKEFGVYDGSKYIRASVRIDRSGDIASKLKPEYQPEWTDETLFLKVLVEGKASLFYYSEELVTKYFYSVGDSSINQLIYKRYLVPEVSTLSDPSYKYVYLGTNKPNIGVNRDYLKQLWLNVRCPENKQVEDVEYNTPDLCRYFLAYNKCSGNDYTDYRNKSGKILFHLKVVPAFSITSLSILNTNYVNTMYSSRNATFSTKPGFSIGLASELVLPFNRNKWALLFEPTFLYYNDEKVLDGETLIPETATIRYKSIEFPLGMRYYCYLNKGFRVSFAALMVPTQSVDFDSYLSFGDDDVLKLSTASNFAVGAGVDYNRFSVELRYYTKKPLMLGYTSWSTNYQTFSLQMGFRIF
jgi:hypothetical protein